MKKIVIYVGMLFCAVTPMGVFAQGGPLDPINPYEVPTDNGNVIDVNVIGNAIGQQDSFVNVVKGAVNRVLGVLALIALLVLLWGGFQMVTSAGNDDQYGKGFTILKHAAAGLLLIGVAWFIISMVFWLVNVTAGTNPGPANTNQ